MAPSKLFLWQDTFLLSTCGFLILLSVTSVFSEDMSNLWGKLLKAESTRNHFECQNYQWQWEETQAPWYTERGSSEAVRSLTSIGEIA